MKSNVKKRPIPNKNNNDNRPTKENKKDKGNPFWKKRKKEKKEEDDNFEEVKADAPTNVQPTEESDSR